MEALKASKVLDNVFFEGSQSILSGVRSITASPALRDHSFSTNAILFRKITFLVCLSGGKKFKFFGLFCVRIK